MVEEFKGPFEQPYVINRLVLIGNGFDLSHGLKTSYSDFIFAYFKIALEKFKHDEKFKDELFELKYGNAYRNYTNVRPLVIDSFEDVKNILESFKNGGMVKVKSIFHSKLFEALYKNLSEMNWVDVENIYFESLVSCKDNSKEIAELNSQFEIIKSKLEDYLSTLHFLNNDFRNNGYTRLFAEKILKDEVAIQVLEEDLAPSNIYFLNFNYTNTIDNYLGYIRTYIDNVQLEHNFIHGELKNHNNPIIFGYGDEIDQRYLEFENLKNNELFTHIKSFKYSQTSNYHNLIRFIEADDFQVFIIGHSCGLSDRTMLNEIFENSNCISIKVFYYQREDGTDDFTEKTYEISKHFRDKGLMRKKLVPKSKSSKLPAPTKI